MKTFFYSDEVNDDFAFANIKEQVEIPDDYKYVNNNLIYRFIEFLVYRIIMTPYAFLALKLNRTKIINKKVLRKVKGGYYLYGNHTQYPNDAYIPNVISFPKKSYIVVNPDAVSIKGIGWFVKMAGAHPLPTNIKGLKNFTNALYYRAETNPVVIFPEAHIWPCYTKIRPYKTTSFKYPVKTDKPSFCFTTTYIKRENKKKPNIKVYVDGPFYPNKELSLKDREQDLRDRIYNTMVLRSKNSNFEKYDYVYKENKND